MTTVDYLKQIIRFEAMIQRKKDEIERLDLQICGTSPNGMNPDKVQTSLSGDKMSTGVARLVDLEKETDELMQMYIEKRKHIIGQIDSIEDMNYYVVLNDHYVKNYPLTLIADNMNCGERTIFRYHKNAIEKFEKEFGEEYLDIEPRCLLIG